MDPRHDPDLILGHLEGDLSPGDTAKVQALREADPDFAALLDGLAGDRDLLRAAPAAEPPAGLADAAMADLERSMLLDDADNGIAMLPPGRRRRFAIAPVLTYGGIAAVLALTASAVLKSVQPPASSPTIAAAPAGDGFDIAAAPIQAQRELARLDRAEVGFGADDAADADAPGARADALSDTEPVAAKSAPPSASKPAAATADRGLGRSAEFESADAAMPAETLVAAEAAPEVALVQRGRAEQTAAFGGGGDRAAHAALAPTAARTAANADADRSAPARPAGAVVAHETLTLDEADADRVPDTESSAFTLDAVYVPDDASDPVSIAIRKLLTRNAGDTRGAPPAHPKPGDLVRGITPARTTTPVWDQPLGPLGTDWARWTTLTPPR